MSTVKLENDTIVKVISVANNNGIETVYCMDVYGKIFKCSLKEFNESVTQLYSDIINYRHSVPKFSKEI